MNNFYDSQKTNVIFGKDTHKAVGEEIKKYGSSCLIVHDGGDYLKDILTDIRSSLEENGVSYYEMGDVKPNPRLSYCRECMNTLREKPVDFILAVGGGSVMDTAKFIAVQTNMEESLFENRDIFTPYPVIPHGVVSTLGGTGSEQSLCAMIVDDSLEVPEKVGLYNLGFFFDFAIINPEFAYTLPPKMMACGAMDILSHCWEVYFAPINGNEIMEGYFEGIVRAVLKEGLVAKEEPTNYEARANLNLAAIMAMSNTKPAAGEMGDWVCHHMENPVTVTYKRTHGEILSIITDAWVKYAWKSNAPKFVRWAVNCMGAHLYDNQEDTVMEGLQRLEDWQRRMGLPTRFRDIGLEAEDLQGCAKNAMKISGTGKAGAYSAFDVDMVMEVYRLAQ
ncbi:MAG: iron-containing alcohol dehydrogenase [Lachnospiraceae bacterium]|jgi:alcohol dehydrogenase YqhD (iron-dependent ADH family)|nr:iron-containing alcohol dehydrogenase [Lachnospiraceae bacterium]